MPAEIFRVVGRIVYEGGQQVQRNFDRVEQGARNVEKKLKAMSESAAKAADKLETVGNGFKEKVTAPLLAIGGAAMFSADQFDQAQGTIAAKLGLTEQTAARLTDTARNLWRQGFGENVDAAANAVALVSQNMRNLPADQLEDITAKAMTFEKVFGEDIQASTRTANTMMATFGISGTQAFDLMTVAAQRGGNVSGDLLDTLNEYSPQFAAMGYSADEFAATLIAGAESGVFSMDKLADSAKESFLRIGDGSKTTQDALGALGLDAGQVMRDINSGGEGAQKAFMAVGSAIAGVQDPAQRSQLAIALMGTPLEDLGPQFQNFFNTTDRTLTGVEGAADRATARMQDNFGTRLQSTLRRAGEALEPLGNALINLADQYLPKVEAAIQRASNWFENLSADQQQLVVKTGLFVAALGPLLLTFSGLIRIAGGVAGGLAPIVGLFAKNGQEASKAAKFFSSLGATASKLSGLIGKGLATGARIGSQAIQMVTRLMASAGRIALQLAQFFARNLITSIRLLGVAFRFLALTPLGLIITAITAAVAIAVYLYRNWDSIRPKLVAVWEKVKSAVVDKVQQLKDRATQKFNDFVSSARNKFNDAKNAIISPIESAKNKVDEIIGKIKGFFTGLSLKIPKPEMPALPHFSLSWGSKTVMGKTISYPNGVDVDWYDEGGIFTKPSIIGVGEKRPEFVGALDDLRQIVREESGGGQMRGAARLIVPLIINGKEFARAVVDDIDEALAGNQNELDRAAGRVY